MHSALLCTHTCGCSQTGEPTASRSLTNPPPLRAVRAFFFFPPSFPLF